MTLQRFHKACLRKLEEDGDRPAGYYDDVAACAIEDEGDSLLFDKNRCCYRALLAKYRSAHRSRGLGDTIARATKAVGIKPCGGCEKRREKLNKLIPYGRTPSGQ